MTEYKCNNCNGTYSDYTRDDREYYHKCPAKKDSRRKIIPDPNQRNENICTCGTTTFPPNPDEDLKIHHASGINDPLPDHKNNQKHWDLWPQGNGYSHILANGKGRKKL